MQLAALYADKWPSFFVFLREIWWLILFLGQLEVHGLFSVFPFNPDLMFSDISILVS